jgi:hypothetical protein
VASSSLQALRKGGVKSVAYTLKKQWLSGEDQAVILEEEVELALSFPASQGR